MSSYYFWKYRLRLKILKVEWYLDLPQLQSITLRTNAFRGDTYCPEESQCYSYYYNEETEEEKKERGEAIKENSLTMKSRKCKDGEGNYLDLPLLSSFNGNKNHFAYIGKVVLESSWLNVVENRLLIDLPKLTNQSIQLGKDCFSRVHSLTAESK